MKEKKKVHVLKHLQSVIVYESKQIMHALNRESKRGEQTDGEGKGRTDRQLDGWGMDRQAEGPESVTNRQTGKDWGA